MWSAKSRPPRDVVLQALDALNGRDLETLRSLCRRDFVAFPASPFLGGGDRPYSGRDALGTWLEDLAARWSSFDMTMKELREHHDRVYCRVVVTVTLRRVSAPVVHELDLVLDTRRGQLTGIRSYGSDRSAALSALGAGRP